MVRDSQVDDILKDLVASGKYKRVEQDLPKRSKDKYTSQVPRVRCVVGEIDFCVSLWTESVYFLSVEGDKVEVPNPIPHQAVLIEDHFNLQPEIWRFHRCFTEQKVPFVPLVLAQSPSDDGLPIFVPTISRMLDGLLCQIKCRENNRENFTQQTNRPSMHVDNLIRYLHLEHPEQSRKVLPTLTQSHQNEMNARFARLRRNAKITSRDLVSSILPR